MYPGKTKKIAKLVSYNENIQKLLAWVMTLYKFLLGHCTDWGNPSQQVYHNAISILEWVMLKMLHTLHGKALASLQKQWATVRTNLWKFRQIYSIRYVVAKSKTGHKIQHIQVFCETYLWLISDPPHMPACWLSPERIKTSHGLLPAAYPLTILVSSFSVSLES